MSPSTELVGKPTCPSLTIQSNLHRLLLLHSIGHEQGTSERATNRLDADIRHGVLHHQIVDHVANGAGGHLDAPVLGNGRDDLVVNVVAISVLGPGVVLAGGWARAGRWFLLGCL